MNIKDPCNYFPLQLSAEVLNTVTVAAFVAKLRSCDLSRYLL